MSQQEVTLIDSMGSDLSVVNAARVSFSKESFKVYECMDCGKQRVWGEGSCTCPSGMHFQTLSHADKRLIGYLARGVSTVEWDELLCEISGSADAEFEDLIKGVRRMATHWTPFAHTAVSLRIKTPIFVARQLFKSQAGFSPPNEVSRRYVDDDPEFFTPVEWRAFAPNVKQGSSDEVIRTPCVLDRDGYLTSPWDLAYQIHHEALRAYRSMIDNGVCPEQARMILPQSMMTTWVWTGNLYAWATLYNRRIDPHAQRETQEVARMIGDLIAPLFPVSWEALTR